MSFINFVGEWLPSSERFTQGLAAGYHRQAGSQCGRSKTNFKISCNIITYKSSIRFENALILVLLEITTFNSWILQNLIEMMVVLCKTTVELGLLLV